VLIARVRAVLRRSQISTDALSKRYIQIGQLRIDSELFMATVGESDIRLTKTEFGILRTLAQNDGKVLTRKQLLHAVQGQTDLVTDRTIDVHLTSLRKKMGETGYLLETVRGVGYRLRSENEKI